MTLAEYIAERRKQLGLSVSAAARLAGVHRLTWRGWEHGSTPEAYNHAGIERALEWAAGSVAESRPTIAASRPIDLEDDKEFRAKVRRAVELIPRVRKSHGDAAADALLVGLDVDPKVRRVIELIPRAANKAEASDLLDLVTDVIMAARAQRESDGVTRSEAL